MYIVRPLQDRFMSGTGRRFLTAGKTYLAWLRDDRYRPGGIFLVDDNGERHSLNFNFLDEEEFSQFCDLPQVEKDMFKMLYPAELKNEC